MVANHIHDALAQVHRVQALILARRGFRGYSGVARMVAGTLAMGAAMLMGADWFPPSPLAHLWGWGIVLVVALALNYGSLAFWFFFNPRANRVWNRLVPAIDQVPALLVGAVLTLVLVVRGDLDLLVGAWMSLYGLCHMSYRLSPQRGVYYVGLFYIGCGVYFLAMPPQFTNPWPMGLVFLAGELVGGALLYRARLEDHCRETVRRSAPASDGSEDRPQPGSGNREQENMAGDAASVRVGVTSSTALQSERGDVE